jgi:hypothetical protein
MGQFYTGTCLVGLLAVMASLASAAESSPARIAAERRLLQSADQRGQAAATEAKRRFETLRVLSAGDERAARYAYGVVLVRLLKQKEALAEFAAATEAEQGPYPPALQAAIFLSLNTRDWKGAAGLARRMGDALLNAPDAWETDTAWSADIRRLGELVSAAQLLVTTADDVKVWADVDQHLRKSLPDSVLAEYAAGFEAVIERQTQLTTRVEELKQDAAEAQGEQNLATLKEVADSKQKVAAQRENLKAAAEDWKKLFDDQMAEYGKQLGKMEKDWTTLDARRQSLERSILLAQQEIAVMQQQLEVMAQQQGNREGQQIGNLNLFQTFNIQMGQRQAQLIQYQFDWNRTAASQNQIQQQAVAMLNQRQSAIADYQKKSGKLIEQDGQLDRWNGRLTKEAAKLEVNPTGETAKTRALQQKLKTVGAYIPWDWEAERQRLLKQLDE